MATVLLNKAAIEVLKGEAERDLWNSIEERSMFASHRCARPDVVAEYEGKMLEVADLLGALANPSPAEDEDEERRVVYITDAAGQWLRLAHESTAGTVEDRFTGDEGDLADDANDAYLAFVLDRVCTELEAVAA